MIQKIVIWNQSILHDRRNALTSAQASAGPSASVPKQQTWTPLYAFRSVIHHDSTFRWPRTLSHISWVARSACFPVAPTLDLHSKQTSLSVCSFGCRQSSIHKKHSMNNEKLKKTWVDTAEISSIYVCKPKEMMSYKSISLSCKKRHNATRLLHLWLPLRLRQESGYSSSGALSPCANCVCPAPVTSLQQHLMFMYILIRSQKSLVYTYLYIYIHAYIIISN